MVICCSKTLYLIIWKTNKCVGTCNLSTKYQKNPFQCHVAHQVVMLCAFLHKVSIESCFFHVLDCYKKSFYPLLVDVFIPFRGAKKRKKYASSCETKLSDDIKVVRSLLLQTFRAKLNLKEYLYKNSNTEVETSQICYVVLENYVSETQTYAIHVVYLITKGFWLNKPLYRHLYIVLGGILVSRRSWNAVISINIFPLGLHW